MAYTYNYPHPAVTVDVLIFTVQNARPCVLLIRRGRPPFAGEWALPGGFVGLEESLKHAAWRELREETGISAAYLEQLHAFGHPRRDPRERVISVAYYALIPPEDMQLRAASDAAEADWFPIGEVPSLAFDHERILNKALKRLAEKARDSMLLLQMMPTRFTLPELQSVYETITVRTFDKRNFRKRILAFDAIESTGETRREGAHRPAKLYRLIDRTIVQSMH